MPLSNRCLFRFDASFDSMPLSIRCLFRFDASFDSMPISIRCLFRFDAYFDSMPISIRCLFRFDASFDSNDSCVLFVISALNFQCLALFQVAAKALCNTMNNYIMLSEITLNDIIQQYNETKRKKYILK